MQCRLAKLIFIGGLIVWLANAALWCASGASLGHDEARYASDTRELLDGNGKRYIYVPVGMNAIAMPGVLAGGDERALRVMPLVAGLLFLLAAWQLARRTVGTESAHWLVGVLAGAHPFVQFSAQLLSDLPSTGCMLAALAIAIRELSREDGPRYRLVAAAPLCAAAFYIRYGSCLTLVLIVAAAIAIGWRGIARRPMPVIVTCLAFVALLAPHALDSLRMTGSPLGVLHYSATVPPKGSAAFADYFLGNPFNRYGVLVAPLLVVGALSLCRDRVLNVLQVLALAQIVMLALTTAAQTRYVFFAIVLFVTVGVGTTRRWIAAMRGRMRVALAATATVVVVLAWTSGLVFSVIIRDRQVAHATVVRLASDVIRADAAGAPCQAFGRATAQLDWYSHCHAHIRIFGLEPHGRLYAVITEGDAPAGTTIFYAPGIVRVVRLQPLD